MSATTLDFFLTALHQPLSIDRLCTLSREEVNWDELFELCRRHGLLPLVNRSLQQLSPELFPEPYRGNFRNAAAACTLRSLQMTREMHRVLAGFADASLPVIPFKGAVLAEQAYGDAGLRDFVDIDLLVPKARVAEAVVHMENAHYRLTAECAALDRDRWLTVTNQLNLQHEDSTWLVEVHWDFAKPWFRLQFPFDQLWDKGDPASAHNRLDDLATLLQLCVHGTSHYWDKFKWVVDIDRFVRSRRELDWPQLFTLAREAECTRAVRLGLSLANRWLGLPLPELVLKQLDSDGKLPWLRRFVARGWRRSAESKRSLPGRVMFILACRESLPACWQSLRQAALSRIAPSFRKRGGL